LNERARDLGESGPAPTDEASRRPTSGTDGETSLDAGSGLSEAREPAAVRLESVTKQYGPVLALDAISLTLGRKRVVGLVGENGAGKSTLLSVINGTTRPDAGRIWIVGEEVRFGHPSEAARHGIATVFQEQGLVPTLTVYENIFLGREESFTAGGFLKRRKLIRVAREVLDELGVPVNPTAYTGSLSFAERQLVEITKAFALSRIYPVEPIVLLDEPTSALSDHETERLFRSIRQWRERGTLVFVSHRLAEILGVCDEIVILKDGVCLGQGRANDYSEETLHELMVGRKREVEYYREARQREPDERVVLRADRLTRRGVLADVSLAVRAGEILGVAGVVGSGKSELARAIAGTFKFDSGLITVDGRELRPGSVRRAVSRGISLVPGERALEGVIGVHSIEWNLTLPSLDRLRFPRTPLLDVRRARKAASEWIERLAIVAPGPATLLRNLSGGNQQKVVFAKWLSRPLRVLVLDDPARGIDVGAKEQMYNLLRELAENGLAILLVSDNLPELIGLCNRIVVLRDGVVQAVFDAPLGAKPTEAQIIRAMV
jgi:ribose transport system ATP-binding protein